MCVRKRGREIDGGGGDSDGDGNKGVVFLTILRDVSRMSYAWAMEV